MSDLQCPARLLFVAADGFDRRALLAALGAERVAGLWAATEAEAAELAQALGLGVRVDERLSDPDQLDQLIEDVADLGRGETTVLLGRIGPLEVLVDGDGVRRRPWLIR